MVLFLWNVLWCGVKLCAEVYRVRVVVQCGQALCCDVIA